MLLSEAREQEREVKPEEFFARFILNRAFESEQDAREPDVLQVGLINSNTAYELGRCEANGAGQELFIVRIASYPSKGIEDWVKSGIFSTRHEAQTYVHYLKLVPARMPRRV
jgi:hypothetical protein